MSVQLKSTADPVWVELRLSLCAGLLLRHRSSDRAWHDYTDGAAPRERSYVPTDDELLRELTAIALAETGIGRYLEQANRSALRFTYQDLLREPGGLLRNIGKALRLCSLRAKPSARSDVRRLEYRDRDDQIASFSCRFAAEIAFLAEHRESFSYHEFRA